MELRPWHFINVYIIESRLTPNGKANVVGSDALVGRTRHVHGTHKTVKASKYGTQKTVKASEYGTQTDSQGQRTWHT